MIPAEPTSVHRSALRNVAICGVFALTIFAMCLLKWKLYWQTNDDVAMSMVAHGYGLSAYPSGMLVFSNVLYGQFLKLLPQVLDVFPYSYVSLTLLLASGWAICCLLADRTASYLLSAAVVALAFVPAIVSPQFTLLAGLLACTGIAALVHYTQTGRRSSLVLAAGLLLSAFLVREVEFYLIVLVAAPLLPYRAMRRDRFLQLALMITAASIISAKVADYFCYFGPDWKTFGELHRLRAAFTDFGAFAYFRDRKELLTSAGFTVNDIELIKNWFFVDDKIADPARLASLLARAGVTDWAIGNFGTARTAFYALAERNILPLVVAAIASWTLVPAARKKSLLSWIIFLVSIGAMGVLGRPGVLRTYYPIMCGLLIWSLMAGGINTARKAALLTVTVTALALTVMATQRSNTAMAAREKRVAQDLLHLDKGCLYVAWGGTLDFEAAYPVLGSAAKAREYRWYPLGTLSQAPFALSQWHGETYTGLMDRLLNGPPVGIVANDELMSLLAKLFEEHYGRHLRITESRPLSSFHLYEITAQVP